MTVTRSGRPARLEPYLGAYGHLVVLREGDLGYVHVHPETELVDGKVKFWLAAPRPGRYRMFFDFQVAGQVHTAAWTAVVGPVTVDAVSGSFARAGVTPHWAVSASYSSRWPGTPVRRARSSRLRGVCAESTNSTTSTL